MLTHYFKFKVQSSLCIKHFDEMYRVLGPIIHVCYDASLDASGVEF